MGAHCGRAAWRWAASAFQNVMWLACVKGEERVVVDVEDKASVELRELDESTEFGVETGVRWKKVNDVGPRLE
jgi:hypothetical protein